MWKSVIILVSLTANVFSDSVITESCGKHEYYDHCPPSCFSDYCLKRLEKCLPSTAVCKPRCRCDEGYCRNEDGVCVPQKEPCKKNEVLDLCPCGCPLRTCGFDDKAASCAPGPKVGDPKCPPPACRCKDGFYRNDKGECVPWKECPTCTGQNEVYNPCPNPCPPQRCDVDPRVIKCAAPPQIGDPECQPGCVCKDGYVRDSKGKCILRKNCPNCTKPNEEYVDCPSSCDPNTCESIGQVFKCTANCGEPGCRCKKGYRRNKRGECIPEEYCLKCNKPNEHYACGGACDNVCATLSTQNQTNCPIINVKCNDMCYCDEGYARDAKGNCIPIKDCPKPCGKHEYYDHCPPPCFSDYCLKRPEKCLPSTAVCKPRCRCDEGYCRNEDGVCVPEKEPCKKNEVLDLCPCRCPLRTCGFDDKAASCAPGPKVGDPKCPPPACRCKDGYYRNDKGECVPWKECPTCTGQNEVYNPCPNPCPPQRCDVDPRVIKCAAPPQIGDPECQPGCVCKDGYVRDSKGKCILRKNCPNCTKPNEEYVDCPSSCDPNTCESIGQVFKCTANCGEPGCRCKKGYRRNKRGECIPEEYCLKCNKPNEHYACGGACDNVCATLSTQNQTNCPIINVKCNDMCYCDEGYARDAKGNCIPIKDCPKPCGKHEYYDHCPPPCFSDYCLKRPEKCLPPTAVCKPRCRCDEGYCRNEDGVCVPEKEPCKKNEVLDLCPCRCPLRTCGFDDKAASCAPGPKVGDPKCPPPACRCKDGYYRNDKGECVPWKECPTCTGQNEVYNPCPNPCPPQRCDVDPRVIKCAAPPQIGDPECQPGCVCKDGYVRDSKGKCILRKNCPNCTKPNEEYVDCPSSCDLNTCESIGQVFKCTANCGEPGCRCKKGYRRNKRGECIPEEYCLKCNKPNEHYACGGACDNVCATLSTQNQTNCPIINVKCNDMCYCDEGYARDAKGNCIPIKDCPKPCGKHEYYDHCPPPCFSDYCLKRPEKCLPPTAVCKPRCRCDEGYCRNEDGVCVPEKEPCKKNEVLDLCPCGCPLRTCGFDDKAASCAPGPKVGDPKCPPPACRCKDGYYRNKKGECVLWKDCP